MKKSTYPQLVRSTKGSIDENGTISLGMKRAFSFMFCLLLAFMMQVNTATSQTVSATVVGTPPEWCPNCTAEDIKVIGVDIVPLNPKACVSDNVPYKAQFVFHLVVTAKQRYGLVVYFQMHKKGTPLDSDPNNYFGNYYYCTTQTFFQGDQTFPDQTAANPAVMFPLPAGINPNEMEIVNVFTAWDNQNLNTFCDKTTYSGGTLVPFDAGGNSNAKTGGSFSIADCKKIAPKCKSYLDVPIRIFNLNPRFNITKQPSLCASTTAASLSYEFINPNAIGDQYKIDFADTRINDVNLKSLPANSVDLVMPSNLPAGTYMATMTAVNSVNGCYSSQSFMVTVNAKTSISGISGNSGPYCVGDKVTLSASASGTGPFMYQWYSSSSNTNEGGTLLSGETKTAISITAEEAGTTYYYLVAEGACGSAATTAAGITVRESAHINEDPKDATYCEDAATQRKLTVSASGAGLSYAWYVSSTANTTNGTAVGINSSAYAFTADKASDLYYFVVVSGSCGAGETSAPAHVIVNAKPVIKEQPASTSYCKGGSAKLSVKATGYDLSYVWFSYNSQRSDAVSVGNTSAISITSTSVGVTNYYVVVNGGCGSVTSGNVSVTANAIVGIGTQPKGDDYCKGATAHDLVVIANGSNLSYQWYSSESETIDNAQSIDGAVSSRYTPIIDEVGSKYYFVIVKSQYCNSVTSEPVEVQVTDCGSFCTYTQGYYGNDIVGGGGMASYPYDGGDKSCTSTRVYETIWNAIDAWKDDKIVLGIEGVRSVTISKTDENVKAIRAFLPAGGTPAALPYSLSPIDYTITALTPSKNNLLAQTLTLALNIGLNAKSHITDFPLQAKYLSTEKAVTCGSTTPVTSNVKTVNFKGITPSMDLDEEGVTIGDIYKIANMVLGGKGVELGITPSQIAGIVGAINEGFDECRIAKSYSETAPAISTTNLTSGISVKTYPNPFISSFNIVFTSSSNGDAKVDLFDESGRNLGVILKNNVIAGTENIIQYKAPLNNPAVIFYRITIGNNIVTGKALSQVIR